LYGNVDTFVVRYNFPKNYKNHDYQQFYKKTQRAFRRTGPEMLKKIGVGSLDQLIDETVSFQHPDEASLDLPEGMNEYQYLNHLKIIGSKNKIYKTSSG